MGLEKNFTLALELNLHKRLLSFERVEIMILTNIYDDFINVLNFLLQINVCFGAKHDWMDIMNKIREEIMNPCVESPLSSCFRLIVALQYTNKE